MLHNYRHAPPAFVLSFFLLIFALSKETHAQPSNDNLADAAGIASLPFDGSGTNVGATVETSENGGGTASVWWGVTPSQDGILKVNTLGSDFNTTLSVWTGAAHPLTREKYNNDAEGGEQSKLAVAVTAGTTYYIRVADGYFGTGEGTISLSAALGPPLPNDDLADAVAITALPFNDTKSNAGATIEPDEADLSYNCDFSNDARDNSIWWKYTPSSDGILSLDNVGTAFGTNLSVWTGSGHPLTEQACGRRAELSEVQVAVETDTTYYIRAASHDTVVEGDIILNISLDPPITNDDLADATTIATAPFTDSTSNFGATLETDEMAPSCNSESVRSVWWEYTPAEDGVLLLDTEGSDFFHVMSLWTGSGHPLTEQNCNYGGSRTTEFSHIVTAGQTYYIRVSGSSDTYDAGNIVLNLDLADLPENDDLADATEITSLPYNTADANYGATLETNEAVSICGNETEPGPSVWWAYTPTQDGVLTVDTDGSDFDLVLSIWTGEGHPLSANGCSDDSPEKLTHGVDAGTTYYLRVAGYSGDDEGNITLDITLGAPLPNDDLADAVIITSLPHTATASNVGATQEDTEVLGSCKDQAFRANSVWWKYTPSQIGNLTIDLGSSTFDTMFSIWTGDGHPLTSQGCTDNSEGTLPNVMPGETYYIRVTGYEGEAGDISLSVSLTQPDPVYVDIDATGNNNGTSWSDAYTDLHDALSDGGRLIWVAEGTYPNGGSPYFLPNARIFGGFDGTESHSTERDPIEHETILTGTANHVLRTYNSPILDGFTITGGTANGTGDDIHGGGLYAFDGASPTLRNVVFRDNSADGNGGAIYFDCSSGRFCSPDIEHAVFENNSAGSDGGAIYNDGSDGGGASPELYDVIFQGNTATNRGGAMRNYGGLNGSTSSPILTNVVFADNTAQNGGAMDSYGDNSGTSSPRLTNVLFVNNSATAGGGAMYNSGAAGTCEPSLTNVTFFGNTAGSSGGVIFNSGGYLSGTMQVIMENSIIWGNPEDQASNFSHNSSDAWLVSSNSIIEGGCPTNATCTSVLDEDPDFDFAPDPDGGDNTYGTTDDGLRLEAVSPAIDAGLSSANSTAADLSGIARLQGDAIDLGPYEYGSGGEPSNSMPVLSENPFISPGDTVLIGGESGNPVDPSSQLTVEWNEATDEDGDSLRYTWRLLNAASNGDVVLNYDSDTPTSLGITYEVLAAALDSQGVSRGGQFTFYQQLAVSDGIDTTRSDAVALTLIRGVFVGNANDPLPERFDLGGNYPNPFSQTTTIPFELSAAVDVELVVYNILGQKVAVLIDEPLPAGYHKALWQTPRAASGVYFYRLRAGHFEQVRRMVIAK